MVFKLTQGKQKAQLPLRNTASYTFLFSSVTF